MTPERVMARYRAFQADRDRFQEIALAGRQKLVDVYRSNLPEADKHERKKQVLAEIRQDYEKQRSSFKLLNYDDWFGPNLNNAYLAGIAQYHVRLDAFAALFAEQGKDFGKFYAACDAIGRLASAQRQAELNRLAALGGPREKPPAAKPARPRRPRVASRATPLPDAIAAHIEHHAEQ
jgi:predicted aminopeptidase